MKDCKNIIISLLASTECSGRNCRECHHKIFKTGVPPCNLVSSEVKAEFLRNLLDKMDEDKSPFCHEWTEDEVYKLIMEAEND